MILTVSLRKEGHRQYLFYFIILLYQKKVFIYDLTVAPVTENFLLTIIFGMLNIIMTVYKCYHRISFNFLSPSLCEIKVFLHSYTVLQSLLNHIFQ